MLLPTDVKLGRDEVTKILQVSPFIVNALVSTGAMSVQPDGVPASELERFLRDSLLRLYQAQAMRAATAPALEVTVEQPQPVEIDAGKEEEALPALQQVAEEAATAEEHERPDLRRAARYVPRRQLGGVFGKVRMTVLQLSGTGLRIRHTEPLWPGEEARLSFAVQNPPKSFVMHARVVWTSVAESGDEPPFCVSGLRIVANVDRLTAALDLLRRNHELHLDQSEVQRKAKNLPRPVTGLADDDVVEIIRAVRKFAADPLEATRWYTRARFSIADEKVRREAPRSAREREEVVGIWEYLQRRIDLRAVAGVVQWVRSSQAAAV